MSELRNGLTLLDFTNEVSAVKNNNFINKIKGQSQILWDKGFLT